MSEPCFGCGVAVKYLPGHNYSVILDMLQQLNPKMAIGGFRTWCGTCWRAKKV